jgi:hypothetical protein
MHPQDILISIVEGYLLNSRAYIADKGSFLRTYRKSNIRHRPGNRHISAALFTNQKYALLLLK